MGNFHPHGDQAIYEAIVRLAQDAQDRRVVWTQISEAGLALLSEMDPTILLLPRELLGHLERAELEELIRLLELARKRSEEQR